MWIIFYILHVIYGVLRFKETIFAATWRVFQTATTVGLGWNLDKPIQWKTIDLVIACHMHLIFVGNYVLLIDLLIIYLQERSDVVTNFLDTHMKTIAMKRNFLPSIIREFHAQNLSTEQQLEICRKIKSVGRELEASCSAVKQSASDAEEEEITPQNSRTRSHSPRLKLERHREINFMDKIREDKL